MKQTYRKKFRHAFEAEETAKGFRAMPSIDGVGPNDVWLTTENGSYWVHVALTGEVDQAEVLAATGYERVK